MLILVLVAIPSVCHAYLDPATGSVFLQLILVAIVGFMVTSKLYYRKIKAFFSRLLNRAPSPSNEKSDRQQ